MACIWHRSKPVILIGRHFSAARIRAGNISFKTSFSPQASGMIFMRRRCSTNNRLSRLVVRIILRCCTGIRRCAMQASKSSSKQAVALGNSA